jgi:DNA-binding PadR family transcriptional regulator
MTMKVYQLSELGKRAIELLEEAIGQIRDGEDAISTVSYAEAVLRVEVGELRPDAIPTPSAVEYVVEER